MKMYFLNIRHNLDHDLHSAVSSDLLTETWFLSLLGMMLTVMTLLFAAMLIVRRRHLMMKENPLPNLYGKCIFRSKILFNLRYSIFNIFFVNYLNRFEIYW